MYALFQLAGPVIRVVMALYWISLLRGSLAPDVHGLTEAQCQALLVVTLLAAGAQLLAKRRRWMWTQIAFAILSVGVLRIAFAFNQYSAFGLAIWIAAFIGMWETHWRVKGERPRRAKAATPIGNGVAAQASAPSAAVARPPAPEQNQVNAEPVYDFSSNLVSARYSFADIVGMSETKQRLLGAAQEIVSGQGRNRNGMLLFGDPGNGKTLFAEALAGELKVPFFSIAYSDIASKWVNETPQKIKAVFDAARKVGVGVFFIDEFDSFIKARDGEAHHMDRDATNAMLTAIVGLRGTKVVLVAATNFLETLDGAAIREGRFDYKIEIPAPDLPARQAILRRSIGEALGYESADNDVIATLADRWDGFSASRLASLGPQLADMRRDGVFSGKITFELGMKAMRLLQGRRGKLPENVKSIDEIIMPDVSRNALRDLAFKMENVYSLEKIGGRLPPGVIFIGPPGTGKTQAAMALAKASNWAFLKITGAQITAKWEAWDKVFREARDIRPAIIFLDEADGILQDRQYSNYGMLTEKILTSMDGAGGRVRDVIFIAATNYYDRIDSAALRGGRFEEKIAFDVPSEADMVNYVNRVFDKLAVQWQVPDDVKEQLTRQVTGLSIADADAVIQKAVDTAAVRRLRDGATDIRLEDVRSAVRAVRIG